MKGIKGNKQYFNVVNYYKNNEENSQKIIAEKFCISTCTVSKILDDYFGTSSSQQNQEKEIKITLSKEDRMGIDNLWKYFTMKKDRDFHEEKLLNFTESLIEKIF